MKTNNIKILNWNANGLKRQENEFRFFLSNWAIDIACVTETHLHSNLKFNVPGYETYRKDRAAEKASGGVALIIKKAFYIMN